MRSLLMDSLSWTLIFPLEQSALDSTKSRQGELYDNRRGWSHFGIFEVLFLDKYREVKAPGIKSSTLKAQIESEART